MNRSMTQVALECPGTADQPGWGPFLVDMPAVPRVGERVWGLDPSKPWGNKRYRVLTLVHFVDDQEVRVWLEREPEPA